MPSFFIAHGSPMLAIEDNEYTRALKELGDSLPTPDAIVVFSAHWTSRTLTITSTVDTYRTIYDFGGFPQALYEITYPAKGSVHMADEVVALFQAHGLTVERDNERGLDHGSWVILRHLFPQADIPVVTVSVNPFLPPAEQYRIGQALTTLQEKNIVVIGSGGTVHTFRHLDWSDPSESYAWAEEFDLWLIEHMKKWDTASLFDYKHLSVHAALATPDYEHFLPLFIAMGAGDEKKQSQVVHRSYRYGSLSHLIMKFG
ncbi:MAG TPA: class III extradiol ring-cleavage dioxygenase [Bacilli bacterium]|nr:class III extradiol ring-cleavage dioxygenase [Bacilli bacterium]